METTCGSLISELQKMWDEVGEPESVKDKMLLELEQECLEAYRRKVDQASQCRAQLCKAVANAEAELAYICSATGERPLNSKQSFGSLKEELEAIMPMLEEMQRRKKERIRQFVEVLDQIKYISKEISSCAKDNLCMVVNENDLSLKRLEELHNHLSALQKEKSDRLKQVVEHLNMLNSLCVVLGVDFKQTVERIHPSLYDSTFAKSVNIETMKRLLTEIQKFHELKKQRLKQLQDLATNMMELWSLMDIPTEEQLTFQNVTRNISSSENEITEPNVLSFDFISYAETEVLRLQDMKSSKMREVIVKKMSVLEDLCKKAHMVEEGQCVVDYSVKAIESGTLDPSYVLVHIETQLSKVKEEALIRKDILDKVDKWLAACEEETWLEDYNRDDNRYNAGRGTHLILKRAEKARATINKIPAMVEALTSKATAWQKDRGVEFSYDGVSLLSMLEKYTTLMQEKELDRQRKRDHKKLQGQLLAEQEVLFGAKTSPSKSGKKAIKTSIGGATSRRMSLGGAGLSSYKLKQSSSVKHTSAQNHHPNYSPANLSFGKKFSAIDGTQVKQSPLIRKPLSPVNSVVSSKANTGEIQVYNTTENTIFQNTPTNETPKESPVKTTFSVKGENRTPRAMPIPVPTPSPVSVAMRLAATPATNVGGEDVEYSFEEGRASFILPKSYLKSLFQI